MASFSCVYLTTEIFDTSHELRPVAEGQEVISLFLFLSLLRLKGHFWLRFGNSSRRPNQMASWSWMTSLVCPWGWASFHPIPFLEVTGLKPIKPERKLPAATTPPVQWWFVIPVPPHDLLWPSDIKSPPSRAEEVPRASFQTDNCTIVPSKSCPLGTGLSVAVLFPEEDSSFLP